MKRQRNQTAAYYVVEAMSKRYSITLLCEIAQVSRSGYYKWQKRLHTPTKAQIDEMDLKEKIADCYQKVAGVYGYRRVKVWLQKKHGIVINHKRVYRLMRLLGLQSRIRRKRKFFGNREQNVVSGNVLNRQFHASQPSQKWVTDITYIPFNGRRLYLSVLYDLYNNEVISYKISGRNDLQLVIQTIKAGIKKRDANGVLLHSDQGFQYTSHQYHKLLQDYSIIASMSRKGNCLDNACVESFFGHYKSECLYLNTFKTSDEVKSAVRRYIRFYNNERYQSRLKNHSPVEYRTMAA